MSVFVILLLFAAALTLFLALRSSHFLRVLPYVLGWLGSWLTIGSLLMVPFLRLGTPEQMRLNIDWLARQADLIKIVYRLPDAEKWLPPLSQINAEIILKKLEAPNKELLLEQVRLQRTINGLWLMRLAQPVQPMLTVTLFATASVGFLGIVFFGARLLNPRIFSRSSGRAIGMTSLVLLFMLLGYTISLDTLGRYDHLSLRLLLAFVQAQPGPGIWISSLGLALCALGGLADWLDIPAEPPEGREEQYT